VDSGSADAAFGGEAGGNVGGDLVKGHGTEPGFNEGAQLGVGCQRGRAAWAVFGAVRIEWRRAVNRLLNTSFNTLFKGGFKGLIQFGKTGAQGAVRGLHADHGIARAGSVGGHGLRLLR